MDGWLVLALVGEVARGPSSRSYGMAKAWSPHSGASPECGEGEWRLVGFSVGNGGEGDGWQAGLSRDAANFCWRGPGFFAEKWR